jgi:hypothetical protein
MKKISLFILLISIAVFCFGQRKIKKVEVAEKGYSVKLKFKPVTDEIIYGGLTIKITPLSANELNLLFVKESGINGRFEYTYFDNSRNSYFLKKQKRKREKSDYEFLLEGVEWLIDNEKINQNEYEELNKQIVFNYDEKKGYEEYGSNRIISSNPYYIQDKYLSVFKIELSNETKSYIAFDEAIIIQNGDLIYRPLTANFIMEKLQLSGLMNVDKALILERYNLPNSMLIPPSSKFEKLFAVLPIEYQDKSLEISISGSDIKFMWEVSNDKRVIDKLYTFYELNIEWEFSGVVTDYGNVYSILSLEESSIFLENNKLFIDENFLNDKFEIFSFLLRNSILYYGRANNLRGIDFISKEKNKRKRIIIYTDRIAELKKKVKQ